MELLKVYRWEFVALVAGMVGAFFYAGVSAATVTLMLCLLEIVFSFDNAVVNAKYLRRMNAFWQKMFLTVGILIAVFGMRLIFPFVVVALAGHIGPFEAISLAMDKGDPHTPGTYGYILNSAHPAIAGFGGTFLLLLFLNFIFDGERETLWLKPIERPLQRIGKLDTAAVLVALASVLFVSQVLVHGHEQMTVLVAGVAGILTYLAVDGLAGAMEAQDEARAEAMGIDEDEVGPSTGQTALLAGKAAFSLFLFLEVMDASFSFDGVIGAFAVTTDPIIIAIGLGVGAMFVRTMTVHLVRTGSLDELVYLEHGAHWAIGSLAVIMLASVRFELPEVVIGLIGITFITASYIASRRLNARTALEEAKHGIA